MKKIKLIGVYIIFILSFASHFVYDIFPNFIFSILFPINESIWEHMKLIVTPVLIYSLFEYIIYKRRNIQTNNFILSYSISTLVSIILYLLLYLPVHYIWGHNLLFSIALLFVTFIFVEIFSFKIMNYPQIKFSNLLAILFLLAMYIGFGILTYHPPKNNLFYDTQNNSYGINK